MSGIFVLALTLQACAYSATPEDLPKTSIVIFDAASGKFYRTPTPAISTNSIYSRLLEARGTSPSGASPSQKLIELAQPARARAGSEVTLYVADVNTEKVNVSISGATTITADDSGIALLKTIISSLKDGNLSISTLIPNTATGSRAAENTASYEKSLKDYLQAMNTAGKQASIAARQLTDTYVTLKNLDSFAPPDPKWKDSQTDFDKQSKDYNTASENAKNVLGVLILQSTGGAKVQWDFVRKQVVAFDESMRTLNDKLEPKTREVESASEKPGEYFAAHFVATGDTSFITSGPQYTIKATIKPKPGITSTYGNPTLDIVESPGSPELSASFIAFGYAERKKYHFTRGVAVNGREPLSQSITDKDFAPQAGIALNYLLSRKANGDRTYFTLGIASPWDTLKDMSIASAQVFAGYTLARGQYYATIGIMRTQTEVLGANDVAAGAPIPTRWKAGSSVFLGFGISLAALSGN